MAKFNKRDQIKLAEGMYSNGTLKNNFGIHDARKLAHIEYMHSAKETMMILRKRPKITSINQLKGFHKIMFGKIYPWAGKVRDYDISKRSPNTKKYHNFQPYSTMTDSEYYVDHSILPVMNAKKKPTAKDYGNLLSVVNQMHPFREGNGRSTKCFLEAIAIQHGQFLQYDRHEEDAIKGLNEDNVPRIAKHIHVQKLVSRTDLNVQLYYQKERSDRATEKKISKMFPNGFKNAVDQVKISGEKNKQAIDKVRKQHSQRKLARFSHRKSPTTNHSREHHQDGPSLE